LRAQREFVERDVPRVLPLIIGIAQSAYTFAQATFSLVREFGASTVALSAGGVATGIFIAAALVLTSRSADFY
jgi:hypothetical protein